jgi:hypothetical protein
VSGIIARDATDGKLQAAKISAKKTIKNSVRAYRTRAVTRTIMAPSSG